jgi:hypothetical protein
VLPVISSLVPSEYTFAASKKLIPESRALFIMGTTVFLVQQPRYNSHCGTQKPELKSQDKTRPVLPDFTYFI